MCIKFIKVELKKTKQNKIDSSYNNNSKKYH